MNTYKILILCFLAGILSSCERFEGPTSYDQDDFIHFSSASGDLLENESMLAIPVFFASTSEGSGNVDFTVSSANATEGTDYQVLNTSNSLMFSQANGFSDTIWIAPIDDAELGETHILDITLSNSNGVNVGYIGPDALNSTFQVNLIDDDCATRNIAGDYSVTATGQSTDGCCPDPVTTEGTVSISDLGSGNYSIFDWSGGLYPAWYAVFGVTQAFVDGGGMIGALNVQCEDVTGEFAEPFGTTLTITGSVDLDSGVIVYSFVNGYGDTGTVTLSPM